MNKWLGTISSIFLTANVWAGGEINYLDVNDGIVVFATSKTKTGASPTCIATDQADKWAISINSESGRAIYSLLMTAMVTKMTINVESADDCADAEGLERAKRVWLDAVAQSEFGFSQAPMLAPDLNFVSDLASDDSTYESIRITDYSSEYHTVLLLTGKQIINYLKLQNISRERADIRLTVDGELIWDSGMSSSDGGIDLISDNIRAQSFQFNESFHLELKLATPDPDYLVLFTARPIK